MSEIYKSPVTAILIYLIALGVAIAYVLYKFKQKRLFTILNINIYLSFFTYFIITPFQFKDLAWHALGYANAKPFYPYLFESISINFIGLIIFLTSEMYFENIKVNTYFGHKIDINFQKFIVYDVARYTFFLFLIIYLGIVFYYNGNLPILGGRTFYTENGAVSFVYSSAVECINLLALYFGIHFINTNKGLCLFILTMLTSFSTGIRSTLFLKIIYPVVLILIYKKYKKIKVSKFVIPLTICLMAGIFIGVWRDHNSSYSINYIFQILYGNSFSDIRDGAYLFYGYETNMNSKIVAGNTYLSGLLSFLPSNLFEFRQIWAYGKFTTQMIFPGQWIGHLGFRGGYAFEMYVNFRMIGVIILSIVRGYFFANSEKLCNLNIYDKIKKSEPIISSSVFFMSILSAIESGLNCSINLRNIYVTIVLVIILLFMHQVLPMKYKKRR